MQYTNEDYRRDQLIRKIERAIENMTLAQLEALNYELTTKEVNIEQDQSYSQD